MYHLTTVWLMVVRRLMLASALLLAPTLAVPPPLVPTRFIPALPVPAPLVPTPLAALLLAPLLLALLLLAAGVSNGETEEEVPFLSFSEANGALSVTTCTPLTSRHPPGVPKSWR